jgi:hypothetical protein
MRCTQASPTLTGCTFAGNVSGGLVCDYSSSLSLENTIVSFSSGAVAILCLGGSDVTLTCCNIYGNVGGDWVGCIEDQYGINGNISEDPLFCDPDLGDFTIRGDSPCAPFSPPNEECGLIGAWPVGCEPVGVEGPRHPVAALHLGSSHPNPFETSARIGYSTPEGGEGCRHSLRIYDAAGRLVRTLVDSPCAGGSHSVSWNGTNGMGEPVAGGVYFYRLNWGGKTQTRRMILLR